MLQFSTVNHFFLQDLQDRYIYFFTYSPIINCFISKEDEKVTCIFLLFCPLQNRLLSLDSFCIMLKIHLFVFINICTFLIISLLFVVVYPLLTSDNTSYISLSLPTTLFNQGDEEYWLFWIDRDRKLSMCHITYNWLPSWKHTYIFMHTHSSSWSKGRDEY